MVETIPNSELSSAEMLIVDIMSPGFAIERDPQPIGRAAFEVPAASTEAVLSHITDEKTENGQNRFVPYSTEHMELDEAGDTLATGIELVGEGGIVKPVMAEQETEPESKTGRAKELIQKARRSRAGQAVASVACAAAGMLSMPTVATASGSLKQTCATDIFKFTHAQILDNTMSNPGKSSQSININLDFDAVNPACNGYFVRQASVLPQLIRHGHIINENPIPIPLLQGRGFNYATSAGLLDFNSTHDPAKDWHPGDKARFELRLEEFSAQAKRAVDSVTKIEPIKIG